MNPIELSYISTPATAKVILVIEGENDITFLRHFSLLLNQHDASLPDLGELERRGEMIFLPVGGGSLNGWANRLAPLGKPQLHLYDSESEPETNLRQAVIAEVNNRFGCRGVLTRKRSLENYLHPAAIKAAMGIDLVIGDDLPVAELVASLSHQHSCHPASWDELSRRAKKRFVNRAKKWLQLRAVPNMTVDMLVERDPVDEVRGWMETIRRMLAGEPF